MCMPHSAQPSRALETTSPQATLRAETTSPTGGCGGRPSQRSSLQDTGSRKRAIYSRRGGPNEKRPSKDVQSSGWSSHLQTAARRAAGLCPACAVRREILSRRLIGAGAASTANGGWRKKAHARRGSPTSRGLRPPRALGGRSSIYDYGLSSPFVDAEVSGVDTSVLSSARGRGELCSGSTAPLSALPSVLSWCSSWIVMYTSGM